MRIIAGQAKGRRLASPSGPHIRPVLDQVKESIFNILFNVEGLSVLDIFAGTGSIGLEAISRGAKRAVFIDSDREAVKTIKKNIEICGFGDPCRIISKHAEVALKILSKKGEKFDLIFIDPPYLKDLVNKTISNVAKLGLLNNNGRIITEHHPKEPVENPPEGLRITDQRKYGQTLITFLQLDQ